MGGSDPALCWAVLHRFPPGRDGPSCQQQGFFYLTGWAVGEGSGTASRIFPFSGEKSIFCSPFPQAARGQPHTVPSGPSCSQRQVSVPCDVSDIEAGLTPCVQGLQELPLELGILCHIILHQVGFVLEQQWGAHLGEGIVSEHHALPLRGVPALPKPPGLPTGVL